MKPIVVVGSINIDLVATAGHIPSPGETVLGSDFQTHPGGKGGNQAVAVGRLGYPVRMIGRVGNDAFGHQLQASLEKAGVDVAGVAASEGPSGVALIVVSHKGENSIVVIPGANALLTPRDLEDRIDIIRGAGMVLTQLEIPAETVDCLATLCSREGVPLMLDPAPARAISPDTWKKIRWFTPNETEAAFFREDSAGGIRGTNPSEHATMLLDKGMGGVILKLGARGAYIAQHNGLRAVIGAFPVEPADTTAAGDTFNGAFATGLMNALEPLEAARFASAAAAISVTRKGAQPSMPNLSEVEVMLKTARTR